MTSLLLMGHGSPHPESQRELLELRRLLVDRIGRPVALGVLEFPAPGLPTLAAAFETLDREGTVGAQPLLLFEGLHGRIDMPREAAGAAQALGLEVRLGTPFGADQALVKLALVRIAQTEPGPGDVLLFVGRGSSFPEALAGTDQVAAEIAARAGMAHVVCHSGISRPNPAEGMRMAAAGAGRVIVLPWLIHTGILVERIQQMTAQTALELGVEVVQLPHIGNSPELVGLLAERFEALS